jgi:hypothetical protein
VFVSQVYLHPRARIGTVSVIYLVFCYTNFLILYISRIGKLVGNSGFLNSKFIAGRNNVKIEFLNFFLD